MISDPRSLVGAHADLFKLDWVLDPESLEERRQEHGLTDRFTLEASAWCGELHLHLEELAEAAELDLILMGGNAAALRTEVFAQRGSRDNDYLTSASREEIDSLMRSLRERFGNLPDPLFTSRQIVPKNPKDLPLTSYYVTVPALFAPNMTDGTLEVKVEFHLSPASALPETEKVEGDFLAIGQPLRARTPRRPHQVALKAMTLVKPPVGIEQSREGVIPRQIYDLDVLVQSIGNETDWTALVRYAPERYAIECEQWGVPGSDGGPWSEFIERLDEWSACVDKKSKYWTMINAFQGQVSKSTTRNSVDWAARTHRLKFLGRCLQAGEAGREMWNEALELEQRLARGIGPNVQAERHALASVIGCSPKHVVNPRASYWDFLAKAEDLKKATISLSDALTEFSSAPA